MPRTLFGPFLSISTFASGQHGYVLMRGSTNFTPFLPLWGAKGSRSGNLMNRVYHSQSAPYVAPYIVPYVFAQCAIMYR